MGAPVRSTPPSVATSLAQEVYEFEFAQAVRIIHNLAKDKPLVGSRDDPKQDPVNFRGQVSFGISSSDIHKLEMLPSPEMTVAFTGIAGIQGPLPDMFSEILVERIKAKDFGSRDFLDIFNHRLVTFWYKLYCKLYPGLLDAPIGETSIGQSLMDLGGVRYHKEGNKLIPFGTLFWQRSGSARGLEEAVSGFFNISCIIQPFEGSWNEIKKDEQTRLGKRFHSLGVDSVLGRKSYDQGAGFRIILGPINYKRFLDLLPSNDDKSGFQALRSLVAAYFDAPPRYKIELILEQKEVPRAALGRNFALGRNAWLNLKKNYPTDGHVTLGFHAASNFSEEKAT